MTRFRKISAGVRMTVLGLLVCARILPAAFTKHLNLDPVLFAPRPRLPHV